MMRGTRILSTALAMATAVSCVWLHGPEDVRRDLARSAGVKLDRETGITLGRCGMAIARMVTDDDDVPLRGVRKVEVGVYEVVGRRPGAEDAGPVAPQGIAGYDEIVRVHDADEDVLVLVGFGDEGIRRMLVIVTDPDEWVLVRVRGKLDRMVEQAMRMAFEEANREELYEPAVADYRARRSEAEPARLAVPGP